MTRSFPMTFPPSGRPLGLQADCRECRGLENRSAATRGAVGSNPTPSAHSAGSRTLERRTGRQGDLCEAWRVRSTEANRDGLGQFSFPPSIPSFKRGSSPAAQPVRGAGVSRYSERICATRWCETPASGAIFRCDSPASCASRIARRHASSALARRAVAWLSARRSCRSGRTEALRGCASNRGVALGADTARLGHGAGHAVVQGGRVLTALLGGHLRGVNEVVHA